MKVTGSIEFSITERSADRVVAEMPITDGVRNPFGIVNAGAILWFADVAASILVMDPAAGRPTEGMQGFPLAINLNAAFLSNQREGMLRATATFVKRGKTLSVVRTQVTGSDDKLIADVTTSHVPSR